LRVALLRGDTILEVRHVSEGEAGLFWTEPKEALVLALAESSLPHWSVGPRAEAGAGPGLPGWVPFRRLEWPHRTGMGVELSLEAAGHLRISVRRPDGEPLAGASVRVKAPGLGGKVRSWRVLTSEEGAVSFSPAWPGHYSLSPIKAPGRGGISAPRSVELLAGERAVLDIVLGEAQAALRGRVVDQWGEAVAEASLSLTWEGWVIRSVETDAEGRFLVEGLPPAPVSLSLRQRPESLFSVLDPQEIERGFDPVSVTPFLGGEARDLGELRVIRAERQVATMHLVGPRLEELGSLRAYLTLPFDVEPTWELLERTPRKELSISGGLSVEYPAPSPARSVQLSVWGAERLLGTVIVEHGEAAPAALRLER
jgi:hypothetical protein